MNDFTKGEWEQGGQVIYKQDGRTVIATVNYIGMEDEGKANARLIAQAPKMAELLKQLADWDSGKFGKDSNIKIIEISKQASQLIQTLMEEK